MIRDRDDAHPGSRWAARLTRAATSPAAKNIALLFAMVLGAGLTCTILVLTGNADGGVAHA